MLGCRQHEETKKHYHSIQLEFLGCEVSRGFVRPSAGSRQRILGKVEGLLKQSTSAMKGGRFAGASTYTHSVVTTLHEVSVTLRGWSEQYSFCNYAPIQLRMDQRIDELIRAYLGLYASRRKRASDVERRRMLGVWRIQDARQEPIVVKGAQ